LCPPFFSLFEKTRNWSVRLFSLSVTIIIRAANGKRSTTGKEKAQLREKERKKEVVKRLKKKGRRGSTVCSYPHAFKSERANAAVL
jgi:hypothetical protein